MKASRRENISKGMRLMWKRKRYVVRRENMMSIPRNKNTIRACEEIIVIRRPHCGSLMEKKA
jgi:hypothetical protein